MIPKKFASSPILRPRGGEVRIESIDLAKMNRIAKRAINTLVDAAEQAGHGLGEFFEDQLVMEIGSAFRTSPSPKTGRLFPYFKFPYPDPGRKRTDVLLEGRDTDGAKHCVWIEVKFRKRLCEREWREDLEKLRSPRKGQYEAVHHGYWIYLYVFETNPEIVEHFGEDREWKCRKTRQMAEFFVRHDRRRKTGRNLKNIDKAFGHGNTLCSIIPSLPLLGDSSASSGLLVTAQAK